MTEDSYKLHLLTTQGGDARIEGDLMGATIEGASLEGGGKTTEHEEMGSVSSSLVSKVRRRF